MHPEWTDKEKADSYSWGKSCTGWILAETPGLSIKQELMPPGTKEKAHFHHKAQQFFYILSGTATFYLGKETRVLKAQQGLLIKPLTEHFVVNETSKPLEFLVISQPSTKNDRNNLEDPFYD